MAGVGTLVAFFRPNSIHKSLEPRAVGCVLGKAGQRGQSLLPCGCLVERVTRENSAERRPGAGNP